MDYHQTLTSAKAFADHGKLEEWVHRYLLSDGNNQAFSDGLKLVERTYFGPLKMPLSHLSRCCGPEESMKWRVDRDGFENRVSKLMDVISNNVDLPPLIVNFSTHGFELNDGNHRFEAYKRLGVKEVDVIIWITESQDRDRFMALYSEYF